MVDSVVFSKQSDRFLFSSNLNSYHPDRDDQIIAVKGVEFFCHAEDGAGAELKR